MAVLGRRVILLGVKVYPAKQNSQPMLLCMLWQKVHRSRGSCHTLLSTLYRQAEISLRDHCKVCLTGVAVKHQRNKMGKKASLTGGNSPKSSGSNDLQGHPADRLIDIKEVLLLGCGSHAEQQQVCGFIHQR